MFKSCATTHWDRGCKMWFAEKGHSWKYEESSYVIMVKKDIQIVHEIDVEIMWLDLKE